MKEVQTGYAEMLALQCHLALSRNRPVPAPVHAVDVPAEGNVALLRDVVPILTGLSISAPGGRRDERQFPIRLFVPPEASSPRSEAPEGSDPV